MSAQRPLIGPVLRQLATFLVVGGLAWGVYMAGLAFGHQLMRWPDWLTITAAFAVSVAFHFTVNRYFTFAARHENFARQLPRHGALIVANYTLTLLLNLLLIEWLHWNIYLSASVIVLLTTPMNFAVSKYWVFAKR